MEAEERATEEAQRPRVTAVAEAAAVRQPDYAAETYTPPYTTLVCTVGLFSIHTTAVPNEWVNEAIRRMLALENVVKTPAPSVASQRQTRSSQPIAASKEAARQAVAYAEEQFQIAMRKRPSSEEQRAQKKPKLILLPTSEDEEEEEEGDEEEGEEEEEHSFARSDFDDSVDDPAYKEDPKEGADDDDDDADDGGDDDGDDTGLKDWLGDED
ncbi:hypothetical protein RHMOL_Rhmol04G0252100 [Rhododendron molle]|uniref:Uncharacterized protein n=1 Tax=Rhododendron molle TaxID=49168 RepID=A0ACC0P6N2_RHOML|nr:hypothetical protein RHMOL_Rhmol04G0252100 [Rhododendron molle]